MKALFAAAVALAAMPAAAYAGDDGPTSERRICTRIELRGGSRISYQRVCRTAAEWRERLGADWQQVLAGRSVEDDLGELDAHSRDTVAGPNATYEDSFGRPGGGTSGPLPALPRAPR